MHFQSFNSVGTLQFGDGKLPFIIVIVTNIRLLKRQSNPPSPFNCTGFQQNEQGVAFNTQGFYLLKVSDEIDKVHIYAKIINPEAEWM